MQNVADKKNKLKARMLKRRRMRSGVDNTAAPSITSLLDVVTIILVYFIKSFAVSPISVQDPSVELPKSISREHVQSAVVVMVTGQRRIDVEDAPASHVVKSIPTIVVDDKVVAQLDPDSYRVPENLKKNGYVIVPLLRELLNVRKNQQTKQALTHGEGFSGKVVVVADKHTPYRVLTDILVTCGEAGFGDFKFAIAKEGE